MVVKKINGVQTMLVSYWDAGYIKLDVSDPASPKIIGDSDFGTEDPVMKRASTGTPWSLPEGNAHQAEFSHDNRFVLAADEDFDTHRFLGSVDQGAAGPFPFTAAGVHGRNDDGDPYGPQLEDHPMVGDTRFVGDACDPATIPQPPRRTSRSPSSSRLGCDVPGRRPRTPRRKGYTGVIIFAPESGAVSAATRADRHGLRELHRRTP